MRWVVGNPGVLVKNYERYPAQVNIEIAFERDGVERFVNEKPYVMASAQVVCQRERPLLAASLSLHVQVVDSNLGFHTIRTATALT
jgi:hypothetical protein